MHITMLEVEFFHSFVLNDPDVAEKNQATSQKSLGQLHWLLSQ
jgi:hypothetical protein